MSPGGAALNPLAVEANLAIEEHLESTREDWGLDSKYNHFKFDKGYRAEQALNKAFSVH